MARVAYLGREVGVPRVVRRVQRVLLVNGDNRTIVILLVTQDGSCAREERRARDNKTTPLKQKGTEKRTQRLSAAPHARRTHS